MFRSRVIPSTVLLLASCLAPAESFSAPAPTPVTTCGQEVAGPAYLAADLDCSGAPEGPTLILGRAAVLDLAGHTLVSGPIAAENALLRATVECRAACEIVGPGKIIGAQGMIISYSPGAYGRILKGVNRVRVRDAELEGGSLAVEMKKVILSGVTITGTSAGGVSGWVTEVSDSWIHDNGSVPEWAGWSVRGGARATVHSSTIENNEGGVVGGKVFVSDTSVLNSVVGVAGGSIAVSNSVVQGNSMGDLRSAVEPQLDDVLCGTSVKFSADLSEPDTTWGVCALD